MLQVHHLPGSPPLDLHLFHHVPLKLRGPKLDAVLQVQLHSSKYLQPLANPTSPSVDSHTSLLLACFFPPFSAGRKNSKKTSSLSDFQSQPRSPEFIFVDLFLKVTDPVSVLIWCLDAVIFQHWQLWVYIAAHWDIIWNLTWAFVLSLGLCIRLAENYLTSLSAVKIDFHGKHIEHQNV